MIRRPLVATAAMLATGLTLAALPSTASADKGCPPGLAKKHNGCTPPGLAKKGVNQDRDHDHDYERDHRYRVGDRLDGDYVIIRDPRRYDLDPGYTYARRSDTIFRIDPDTRAVLDIIGGLRELSN